MSGHAAFERFLEIMLPDGGCAVTFAEVYIDESYNDVGPPLLCVAGYVFRRGKAREFSEGWSSYLARKKLPYFHMSECAHGTGIFDGYRDTLEVEKELIKLTRKFSEIALATTINETAYAELVQPRDGMRTAYAAALLMLMTQVRKWCIRTGFDGQIAYFFEAGHKHQSDANAFMQWLFQSERIQAKYHYAGHAFLPKATPALHPADMLAWQWRLEMTRRLDPNRKYPQRADLDALLRPHDVYMDWTREQLAIVSQEMLENEKKREEWIDLALRTGSIPPI